MKLKTPYLRELGDEENKHFAFWCPACEYHHSFTVGVKNASGASWRVETWNPLTIHPSLVVRELDGSKEEHRCHMWVKQGKIQYLSDCTHALAGQTIDMVEIEPPGKQT